MTYFGPEYYLLFLPAAAFLYAVMPRKARPYILLAGSYIFFWLISEKLIIYILFSTVSIHHCGLWLDRIQQERKAAVKAAADKEEKKALKKVYERRQTLLLIGAAAVHIGILAVLKYTPFAIRNANIILEQINIQITPVKFAAPIGISFYTLQAVSYITDVRRGTVKADRNIGRLALYMCFFPQVMEGPIARYAETAEQLYRGEQIQYKNFVYGAERIVFGLFKKIVIADRLNAFVKTVFEQYDRYDGGIILLGAAAFTVQLYMDFSGAMDIALGSGRIFGVGLPENFRQPFFSKSISEFWTRWHITLGAWFRDYVYYPVSFSWASKRLGAAGRKRFGNYFGSMLSGTLALFCVWLCNGIWHGSAWMYLFFGMYHFVLIFTGNLMNPLITKLYEKLNIDRDRGIIGALRIIKTGFLVVIGELFFRCNGLKKGLEMFYKIVTGFSLKGMTTGVIYKSGLDYLDVIVVLAGVGAVFVISVLKERNVNICERLGEKNIVIRWGVLIGAIAAVVMLGAYGGEYTPADPMYADF